VWHLHAKYGVFDSSEIVVLSENFVESGLSQDQLRGNRGWGVHVRETSIASCLARLFDVDSRDSRHDVRSWRLDQKYNASAVLSEDRDTPSHQRVIEPMRTSFPAKVSVRISPDCSESGAFLCDMLLGARSIVGEQFQTDLMWDSRWLNVTHTSPIVSSLASSMHNGSSVRLIFDSCWFNEERNGATCEFLRTESRMSGSPSDFRMMEQDGPIEVLHNKGLVIDQMFSLVSSNNWVFASFARNRELAVVVDSQEVASFFAQSFNIDWFGDENSPVADAGEDVVAHVGDIVTLNGSGSYDDHAIASWSWDLYGDGTVDSSSAQMEFYVTRPGKYVAVLSVEDPWGNRDTDELEFTVQLPDEARRSHPIEEHLGWLLLTVGSCGGLGGIFIARSMRKRGFARLIMRKRIDGGT
jgi:hypothetical protein